MGDGCQPRTPAQCRQRHGRQPGATGRPLRVETDCSGLDTSIAALEGILLGRNRQIHHVFSSECDPKTLTILLHNFTPDYHYTDVAHRALRQGQGSEHPAVDQLPSLDIYVAGFPCQAFASCGLSAGIEDPRGLVWLHIVRFLPVALPRAVVLENVKGLVSGKHKTTFKCIMDLLESMEEYDWHTKILNTQDFGVPQHRPRVYIVGIRRDHAQVPFVWPCAAAASPNLDDFLESDPPQSMSKLMGSLPTGASRKRRVLDAMEQLGGTSLKPTDPPRRVFFRQRAF